MPEDWRAELHDLLNACRQLPEVPEPVFRLLELLVHRIEGPWDLHETPTRPNKPPMPRVSPTPFRNVTRILDEGKAPESSSKGEKPKP